MTDNETPKAVPAAGEPHTIKAGIFDAFFGNKGPNGEVMYRGKPLLVRDVPPEEGEEDD